MIITLTQGEAFVRDEGTVLVLQGIDEDGFMTRFGADLRPAVDVLQALLTVPEVQVEVEDWQVIGRSVVKA